MQNFDQDTSVYSIGSVARRLGVSVQTLRLYEAEGMILPTKSGGGQRRYSERDVKRLECIRQAIVKDGISVAGIRRMQSLVPCWSIVHCTEAERVVCPAFRDHDGGCWTYKHADNVCSGKDCRLCEVYQLSSTCEGIKQIISRTTIVPRTEVRPARAADGGKLERETSV